MAAITGHPAFSGAGPDQTFTPMTTYTTDGSVAGVTLPHHKMQTTAGTVGTGAGEVPLPVSAGGSTGTDFTANAAALGLPHIGQPFTTGPWSGYTLLETLPASSTRVLIEVENISGGPIVLMRDDGTAANNAAPVNASAWSLGGGPALGAQGGSWTSTTFRGRLQVYGPTGATVTTFQD